MKNNRNLSAFRGFTLMELMVAMAITALIVTSLVSVTSLALNTWNRSRSELRASRQAKAMIDTMARDLESLVTRKGNTNEWLSAISDTTSQGVNLTSTNATKLFFFSSPTDRYTGDGGNVSCVAYQLEFKDPIDDAQNSKFKTFVLNRLVVTPKETFDKLLGATSPTKSLDTLLTDTFATELADRANFVCENIFQFSVIFHVEVNVPAVGGSTATVLNIPIAVGQTSAGQTSQSFIIKGTGIEALISGGSVTAAQLQAGRVTSVEISATVLTDLGVDRSRVQTFATDALKSKFLAQNSYEYTKIVPVPSM
jgi:prepilin-type N-terminal cleavage/methylation domain-containing protein